MSCKHACKKTVVFPRDIHNRPALRTIDYRVGTYSDMRSHMFYLLNTSKELSRWAHRDADDPGIALVEGTAIVGDILSYYQGLYANEAFLRTAMWRESVADLVQLTGYRLSPGIGGEASFAVAVKGDHPVTIPKGFGFKAQLKDIDEVSEFASTEEVLAYPHLSTFNLYRPRLGTYDISASDNINRLELQAVDGQNDAKSLSSLEIREGDRVLIMPGGTMFEQDGGEYAVQEKAEIINVIKVDTILDRLVISFEGSLRVNRKSPVRAYIIGRSFHHYGHNSPPISTVFDSLMRYTNQVETRFTRIIQATGNPNPSPIENMRIGSGSSESALVYKNLDIHEEIPYAMRSSGYERGVVEMYLDQALMASLWPELLTFQRLSSTLYTDLKINEMALDIEVEDLASGNAILCQGMCDSKNTGMSSPFTVLRNIVDVRSDSVTWGNTTGTTTIITLDEPLIANTKFSASPGNIRQIRFHEVMSKEITLRTPTTWGNGPFVTGELNYYGTHEEVKALEGRRLLLERSDGKVQFVRVTGTDVDQHPGRKDETNRWMWRIKLNQRVEFNLQDFDESDPRVTVYGNVVPATQGKTEDEVVLGSGDQRQSFQTFKIPKAPLTYLLDGTQTPSQVPELKVYVNKILWKRADTFFDSGPHDHVYVVREDSESNSWVQFGDGRTGARLPTGNNNVVAIYRTGSGATGPLEADKNPQAVGKVKELEKVFMPSPAVGGASPEEEDSARAAAPRKMQSLGRLVGLSDFEAEAFALPGVRKVRADWSVTDGQPSIRLIVLADSGDISSLKIVRDIMRTYNRCRGPARFPIQVVPGTPQYVYLDIRAGHESSRRKVDMAMAIKEALGVTGEEGNGVDGRRGLFSFESRQFGESVHISQIIGIVQQVEGVSWVFIDAAQIVNSSNSITDPIFLAKPSPAQCEQVLECLSTSVLALHTAHLDLKLSIDQNGEGCSP